MFADMKCVKTVKPFVPKHVLTLPNGGVIYSEEFSTIEAYMTNQEAEKVMRVEARRQRIWSGIQTIDRKPLFDRKVMQNKTIGTQSSFGAMVAAEMQKVGIL